MTEETKRVRKSAKKNESETDKVEMNRKKALMEYKIERSQGEIPFVTYENHRNAFIGIK